jgi:hypothetical protein
MPAVKDFTPVLKKALAEIEASGLISAAAQAYERCFASFTTSSEWLGEVGRAITELRHAHGSSIPSAARGRIEFCLNEVAKVWPKFRVVVKSKIKMCPPQQ